MPRKVHTYKVFHGENIITVYKYVIIHVEKSGVVILCNEDGDIVAVIKDYDTIVMMP